MVEGQVGLPWGGEFIVVGEGVLRPCLVSFTVGVGAAAGYETVSGDLTFRFG